LDSDGGILDLEEGLVKFFPASSDLQIHGGFGFSGRFVRKKIMPTEAAIKAIPTMNEIVVERILNRTDLTFIRVLAKKAQNKIL
jgi:hypothetical protein